MSQNQTKVCPQCNLELDASEFGFRKSKPHLLKSRCRKCHTENSMEYFYKNRESVIEKKRKYRAENKEKLNKVQRERYKTKGRYYFLKSKYNITLEDYQLMLNQQNGVCALCHKPETKIDKRFNTSQLLSVDHCHTTGKVRGLLCSKCNTALGLIHDSFEWLERAKDYLSGGGLFLRM